MNTSISTNKTETFWLSVQIILWLYWSGFGRIMIFLIRILGKSIISHSVCLPANLFCQRHICAHIATVEQRLHKTFRNTDFEKVLRRRNDTFSTKIIVLVYPIWLVHCCTRLSPGMILRLGTGWWPPICGSVFLGQLLRAGLVILDHFFLQI